jgi:hypothetical protein
MDREGEAPPNPDIRLNANQTEAGKVRAGVFGVVVNEGMPAELLCGIDVFRAVVEEKDLSGWKT